MSTPYSQAKEALWTHLDREHGLTLLDSEVDEIVRLACAVRDAEVDAKVAEAVSNLEGLSD